MQKYESTTVALALVLYTIGISVPLDLPMGHCDGTPLIKLTSKSNSLLLKSMKKNAEYTYIKHTPKSRIQLGYKTAIFKVY